MIKWREGLGLLAVASGGILVGIGLTSYYPQPLFFWLCGIFFVGAGIFLVLFADLDAEDEK